MNPEEPKKVPQVKVRFRAQHGRWETLTDDDRKFLIACGIAVDPSMQQMLEEVEPLLAKEF